MGVTLGNTLGVVDLREKQNNDCIGQHCLWESRIIAVPPHGLIIRMLSNLERRMEMEKEIVKNAEHLDLLDLKSMVFAAENHALPIYPAKGPCGGCDLVIKPLGTAKGPCGGCDVVQRPKEQAKGPCGGCDVFK
jgi:hypothetical protein